MTSLSWSTLIAILRFRDGFPIRSMRPRRNKSSGGGLTLGKVRPVHVGQLRRSQATPHLGDSHFKPSISSEVPRRLLIGYYRTQEAKVMHPLQPLLFVNGRSINWACIDWN